MSLGSDKPSDASTKDARSSAANGDGGEERRGQTRVRSRTFANGGVAGDAARKGGSFLGTTVNLSIGGCLIRTYEALESGMEVSLQFKLPEGDVVTAARIAHVNEDAVGCRMVGVQFVGLAGEARTRLVQHLSTFGVEAGAPDPHPANGAPGRFEIEGKIRST
jgi:hypothetical protein